MRWRDAYGLVQFVYQCPNLKVFHVALSSFILVYAVTTTI